MIPVDNVYKHDMYQAWAVSVVCTLLAPIAALGAVGNVINIKTFTRLGISDGVNMSLISLAASDLFFLISAFINSISLLLYCVEELSSFKVWFPVDPVALFTIFVTTGSGFYAISMLVTTFITVVRCLAVAHPLKFRSLLSWRATAIIVSLFSAMIATTTILLFVSMGVSPQFDPNINTTRPALWISAERTIIKNAVFGIRDLILPLTSQIIVGICVFIMARYLRKANKFRLKMSKFSRVNETGNTQGNNQLGIDIKRNMKTQTKESGSSRMVGKQLKVVQQMLLIAVVYSLCNMPKVVFNLTQLILPDFYWGRRFTAAYLTCNILRELIQTVNASVTIFIYWKYNSKFRNNFKCGN